MFKIFVKFKIGFTNEFYIKLTVLKTTNHHFKPKLPSR